MHTIEIIQKKRDKCSLTKSEIDFLIESYVEGMIPDYQMSAFLMATCINGMSHEETSWLTDAMLYSGEVITHARSRPLVDKHSTGGVGDKISIPLAPAVAACGLSVPMIAGRGLAHTGGTLDKLEAIPGFRCNLTAAEYKAQVEKIGCVIMGQTKEIAPADKKIYALRDVTGTVHSIPLITASIMSKKLAEGVDALVLDVKFGSGAFMQHIDNARALATSMVSIGKRLGKKVTVCLTNMDQPLGQYLGNGLEIVESIEILKGQGPKDSVELTVELGAEMLVLGKIATTLEDGRERLESVLKNGSALQKFVEMVRAQNGDERVIHEPKHLIKAKQKLPIESTSNGFIHVLDCREFGMAVNALGGGRMTMSDVINPAVGIDLHVKIGDRIERGQPVCTLHVDEHGVDEATARIMSAVTIASDTVSKQLLCADRITSN